MKKSMAIMLLLVLTLLIGTASAIEVTLFGPNQYVRTTGPPNVFTDTFTGKPAEASLVIENGDKEGDNRLSSAVILVNGEQVFGPNDFNQQTHILEASISLVEDNSITVELKSKPGSYLTVQVI